MENIFFNVGAFLCSDVVKGCLCNDNPLSRLGKLF